MGNDDDDDDDDDDGDDDDGGGGGDGCDYSQLLPYRHSAITDTPTIRAAAKSPAKINCRRLTGINSRYYRLSLMRTLEVLTVSAIKGCDCIVLLILIFMMMTMMKMLTVSLPNVAKGNFRPNFQISFSKILTNK